MSTRAAPRTTALLVALAAVYLVWGSTYLAIRYALAGFPPFLLAALRFAVAGSVLYLWLRARGVPRPTASQWRNAALSGALLIGLGNGLVCYAEQDVGSGIAAVVLASVTLFAALFSVLYSEWPRRMEWAGLLTGLSGVVLLNLGGDLRAAPSGAIALFASACAWAFGSVWSRRQDMPSGAMNTAAQMLAGSASLVLMALLAGERFAGMPGVRAWMAFAYLVVFGSLAGFTAYVWLLHNVRPALATSYAYVNPPIAVLLGAVMAGEPVGARELVGMAVILGGVVLISATRQNVRR